MKRRAVTFMGLFVLLCTVISVDAGLVFSNVELVRFDYDQHLAQIDAQAHACPPSFWGKWVSQTKLQGKIKQALRTRLIEFQQRHEGARITAVSFKTEVIRSFFGRHQLDGCTRADAVYKVDFPASIEGSAPRVAEDIRSPKGTLKVGLRAGYPMISQLDAGVWHGAAVLFAQMIGAKVGKHVQFVELHNASQRLSAVKHGVVDVVISLLSYTDDRATQVELSEPYFTTGLLIGTTNIEAFQAVKKASELNKPSYRILVATGTTAETYARAHFPKAKIETVQTTPKLKIVLETMRQDKKDANVLFITDEVIAATWDIVTLQLDGKILLTDNERYVVAVKKGRTDLINAVNDVIRVNNIFQMYAELTAR
jgi:ABC-type amino acid transport substrate-binding protein